MGAKRSAQGVVWIGLDDALAASPMARAGAMLAREVVFQQLAFEAQVLSILRGAWTAQDGDEEDHGHAPWS